jgi:membrane-bound serine protease (ClpP class)
VLLGAFCGLAQEESSPPIVPEIPVEAATSAVPQEEVVGVQPSTGVAKIMVIPIRESIAPPELYILRRGVKAAIEEEYDTIILDMHTPGGRLDVTFEMLQALDKFPGRTITYINNDAISAGALISAGTDDIYFAPGGVIGAAAPVTATGADIDTMMQAKMVSYLRARARSISGENGHRGQVLSAMIDINYEFKIGDEIIKPKGELLSLTALEAIRPYGDPPVPLLGAGIVGSVDELISVLHGEGNHSVVKLEVTWSESFSQYLKRLAPILLGLGLLLLFIEFKTPGFGIFGISGSILLGLVFFGNYIAGLSGHEPALFFALGVVLVVIELFVFPGTLAFGVAGVALILGTLVWSMLDLWPDEPLNLTMEMLTAPLANVMAGLILAAVIFLLLVRFLPRGGPWGKMILHTSVGGEPHLRALDRPESGAMDEPLVGQVGEAVTGLFPSGQVEVLGRRYEARLANGFADVGTPVRVTRKVEFGLEVEVVRS